MSSVVIQWLNNEVKLSKRITKESIDTDFRNGYLFAEILKQYELIDKKMFDSLFYNGNSNETTVRNYSLLESGLVQKLGLKIKANRVYDIIKGKPGEAAKLLYDIKTYIELKKLDLTNDNGKIKLSTFMSGDIIKKPYLPKEHEIFISKLKALSKTLPKPKADINALTETNDLRSELDVIYKRKLSVIPTYEPPIKKEIKKTKYNTKTQYELNIMKLEREKKKKKIADQEEKMKNIKKEFIENIENFERNLRNNDRTGLKSKDEIESLNYTDKNNNDYDQTLLADIDIMKASKIVSESSNRYDKQMEIDEIRNFLKYQRNMDPSAYMKMIQKKMPSIETSMRQTHEYLNRIHEKKMKEDETNKEKKYRRRKILLSQQRSRKENEKTALDNFLLNQLLNESKQERRIAEQLMEMRKQKNLIYEDRCKKNQQYAEKREKDYELALIREEELGRKSREEYERKLLLQKQKHDEELLIKEEEKKQETYRIINEIVSELVDLSCKICEYKLTNEGNITKKQIDALKTLIAKGLPLEDKYIFELIKNSEMSEDKKEIADNLIEGLDPQQTSNSILGENYTLTNDNNKNGINNADYNFNNEKKLSLEDESKEKVMENSLDKNNGNKIEENVQGVILMESAPEIPNSLISKMDENENVDLIQVDEANRNVLRGVQILDEEEFMDYLKGQNNWEYTFCHTPPEVPKKMYDSLNQIIDNLTEITKASDNLFEMMELPKVPITISIIGKRYSGKMTLANHLGSMYNLVVLSLEDMIKDAVRATTTDIKPSNEDTNENNITFKAKKGTLTRAQIYSEIQTKISEGGYPGDELLVQLVIDSINRVNTNAKYPDCKGGWVLVNFPQNREQAALLEKELTGYEEPKKAKQSLQKRKSLSNIKIPIPSKKASATIERGFETKEGKLKSGLDLVLLMNADDEAVLKRKTGSKIDTFTGKMYHLEYNPPPENEPEIFERLVPFTDEDDNVHNQNQNILADGFDGQVDSIKDFYNRFKNIYEIDGSKTLRENVESVQFWFNEMINEKEKEEEEKKLEESKGDLDLQKEKKKKEEQENLEKIHEESITDNDLEAYSTQEQNKNIPKDDDKKRNNRSRTLSTREKDLKHKNNSASTITIKTPKVGKDLKKKDSQDNQEKTEEIAINLEEISETQVSTPINEESFIPSNKKKYPSKKIAETLIDSWASIEVNYIETLKFIFRSLRREQNTLTRYFYNTKVNFKKFLDRPNNKQNIVTAFKEEYNQIDNNLRCNDQAKEVLHQRTYDLRDKLWEICDKRKEEAEQERKEIIEDRWIEDHLKLVINIYVTIMQVESDYTIGINQLVHDYYIDPNGPIINKDSINKIKFLINRINSIDKKQPGLTKSLKEINQTSETNKPDSHDSKNNGNNQNNTCNLLNLSSISGSLCNSVLLKESSEHNSFLQNSDGVPYERYIDDAYNLAYSRNEFKDVEVINKEEKDKDLQNTPTETKKEDDKEEIPKDYIDFIQLLQTAYHLNLERVQTKAKDHIENLKKKGTDVFNLLDEWITKRYQIEIKAVNELIILIEHAIEHEELLPDKLIFEDEDFKAKCDQFTNITDILPPSINPVEQLLSEKFTIAQLLNICKMFNECSNTGIISREEFINCFMKLTALSTDMEDLPDDYANNEANQINQITDLLDPFNTGYINWKKFIMNQTGVLPVPNIEYITNLKQLYKNLPSYQNGKVTKNDYLSIKLWYEDIDEEINNKTITIYKKFKNMKEAMFYFFMVENNLESEEVENENEGTKESEEKQNEGETDKKNESVNTLFKNEKETFINIDKNDTNASNKNESSVETNESNIINKESPVKNDEIIDNNNNNNSNNNNNNNNSINNNNNNSIMPSSNEENNDETANKEQPVKKIYQEELFDVTTFLMCCCCDINQRAGIEKAFNIVSDDGLVTIEELYSIYNYGLYTDENCTEKETDISYPKELFKEIFEDLNITPEEKVSFKQVMEIAERNYPLLLTCPFYQLEKIDIETIENNK